KLKAQPSAFAPPPARITPSTAGLLSCRQLRPVKAPTRYLRGGAHRNSDETHTREEDERSVAGDFWRGEGKNFVAPDFLETVVAEIELEALCDLPSELLDVGVHRRPVNFLPVVFEGLGSLLIVVDRLPVIAQRGVHVIDFGIGQLPDSLVSFQGLEIIILLPFEHGDAV